MQKDIQQIFVVDDDAFHLEIMKQLLGGAGLSQVSTFNSGIDCLDHIHQNPEVVFLDHHMDVYNGFETLRKIKRYNPNIFVVMVSAQEDIDMAVATLKHGAFDYIRKDKNLHQNIAAVLSRIEEVKALLKAGRPSLVKSLFKLL